MKKLLCLLLLLSMAMGLCGCSQSVLKSPPEMTVTCGEVSISVVSGDFTLAAPGEVCWRKDTVITCASNPSDIFFVDPELSDIYEVSGHTLSLSFPVKPDEIMVSRIPYLVLDGEYENVAISENLTFPFEDGTWCYLITASWDKTNWSGEASYRIILSK